MPKFLVKVDRKLHNLNGEEIHVTAQYITYPKENTFYSQSNENSTYVFTQWIL